MVASEGWLSVTLVNLQEDQVENNWKIFAQWLDWILAVWAALDVYLEMTGLVLASAEKGTIETHHNCFGRVHILATVAHNLENDR